MRGCILEAEPPGLGITGGGAEGCGESVKLTMAPEMNRAL